MRALLFGWPFAGLLLSVALLIWLVVERRAAGAPGRWQDPGWVLRLLWPMYLLHQFEEHGVDLLGRRYAFLGALCATLGHGAGADCPADPAFIFAVNAVGVQLTCALAWGLRRRAPLVAACAWGVALVNALAHGAPALLRGAYNPGLLSAIVLFLPLSAWMLRTTLRAGVMKRREVARVFACGACIHAVLLGSLVLGERGWLSHGAMLFINGANGLWPLAFGALFVRRRAPYPNTSAT